MRLPVQFLLAFGAVLLLRADRSYADTVTFNNLVAHPDGAGGFDDAVRLTADGSDAVTRINPLSDDTIAGSFLPGNNYAHRSRGTVTPFESTFDGCTGNPTPCRGGWDGTLAPGLLNAALAHALGVNPTSVGGDEDRLFTDFSGNAAASSGLPDGPTNGNTNQLEAITSAAVISAIPEPGSLILLGTGLVAAARSIKRRPHSL